MAYKNPNPNLMTADEVAAFLRVNRSTVINYAKRGLIPGKKIGYLWRFPRAEIEKLAPGNETANQ